MTDNDRVYSEKLSQIQHDLLREMKENLEESDLSYETKYAVMRYLVVFSIDTAERFTR